MIAGTRGSVQLPTLNLFEFAGDRSWCSPLQRESLAAATVDPLARQLAHFCAVLRREAPPLVSADDALQTLRVTLAVAVAEAARSGQVAPLA